MDRSKSVISVIRVVAGRAAAGDRDLMPQLAHKWSADIDGRARSRRGAQKKETYSG